METTSPLIITTGNREILVPPKDVQHRLTKAGGLNPFGEAAFRLVWGWSRLDYIWSRRMQSYDRRPKYVHKTNRWIIESWRPQVYTRDQWSAMSRDYMDGMSIELLGPYPNRGDYEYLIAVETGHTPKCTEPLRDMKGDGFCECGGQRYQALTLSIVDELVGMVSESRRMHARANKNFLMDRELKEQRDWSAMADDMINDAGTPFGGNMSWVPMRGAAPKYNPIA